MTRTMIHPFEKSGLGKAPFRCVGMHVEQGPRTLRDGTQVGAPGQPLGVCDHCGMGIKYVYDIVSADGREFGVGCECVLKTAGVSDSALVRQVKTIKRDHDRKLRQERKAKKEDVARQVAKAQAEKIIAKISGFAEALETDHHIIRDIKHRLFYWGNISDKQIALVFKIADQIKERKAQTFIPVPVGAGRQTIMGKIVAARWEGFGPDWMNASALKAMVVVDTPEGQWKTWGTIPESVYEGKSNVLDWIKGSKVQFTARVKVADNDPTMSFFSRPTNGILLEG